MKKFLLVVALFAGLGFAAQANAQPVDPDLVATSVLGPTISGPGQQIPVTFTVQNQGTDATGFQVGLYLSTSPTISTGAISLGTVDICSLHAGATLTVPAMVTIPAGIANGTYYLGMIADVVNNLVESDKTNNTLAGNQISITNAANPVITALSGPASVFTGGSAAFTGTLMNSGFSTSYWHQIMFYLSLTPQLTSSSIFMGYAWVQQPLDPGQSAPFTFNVGLGLNDNYPPASYYVVAKVSATYWDPHTYGHNVENTIVGSQKLDVIGPDLQVTAVSGPQLGHPGSSIVVSNTVQTKGTEKADVVGPPSSWYNEADIKVKICLFNADRTTVYSCLATRDAGYMGAGGTSADNTTVTIPAGFTPGTYYIGAIADALAWDDNFPDDIITADERTLVSADPITIQ